MAQPAPAALTEQVSRCIVFLESKQRPDKVAAFVAAARDDSVNRPPDVEALHGLLRRQPDLDLSTVSYGSSAVLSVLLLHLAAIAPLVNRWRGPTEGSRTLTRPAARTTTPFCCCRASRTPVCGMRRCEQRLRRWTSLW